MIMRLVRAYYLQKSAQMLESYSYICGRKPSQETARLIYDLLSSYVFCVAELLVAGSLIVPAMKWLPPFPRKVKSEQRHQNQRPSSVEYKILHR